MLRCARHSLRLDHAVVCVILLLVPITQGCSDDDTPGGTTESLICSSTDEPVFLASKLDDDDGDGNPTDDDFPVINDEDDDIADHTWIKGKNGVTHLFFHNEGLFSGNAIEHYTTTNLKDLDYVGVALRPNPNGWDSHGLWAPHIIEYGNVYFMFYTGIDNEGPASKQRIGLATSTDLINWTRYPINTCPGTSGDGCLYECDEPWTAWGDVPGDFNQQCRDPFVIWDAVNQRWLLFATAKSTNQFGVVTVATSTNLTEWIGVGFIDATRRLPAGPFGQTTGGQAENPYIITRDDTHYLLFTDWRDPEDTLTVDNPRTIVQYATSSVLDADTLGSANWMYRGYIPDPGVNAIEVQRIGADKWIMSQSVSNPFSGDYDRRRQLRLKCILWEGGFSFGTANATFSPGNAGGASGPLGVGTSGRTGRE